MLLFSVSPKVYHVPVVKIVMLKYTYDSIALSNQLLYNFESSEGQMREAMIVPNSFSRIKVARVATGFLLPKVFENLDEQELDQMMMMTRNMMYKGKAN